MFFRKRKLYLGQFCRLMAQSCIRVPPQDISKADTMGILTEPERRKTETALPNLRLLAAGVCLCEKGQEGRLRHSAEEVGAIFVEAIKLAYRDCGHTQEDADSLAKVLEADMESYFANLDRAPEVDVRVKPLRFYLCQWFADQVSPIDDFGDENQRYKNALTFDVAKQVSHMAKIGFDEMFKRTRFLD